MAWLYDCCYDRFTPEQRRRVAAYAREFVALADEWRRVDWAQIGNNRGVRGILGSTWLYLALEGEADLPDLEERLAEGVRAVETYLFQAYDAAGASFEGPGYAESLPYLATTALALHRRGLPDLLTNDRFERIPEYLAYELVPGAGYVNPVNDAHVPSGTVAGSLPLMGTPRGALLPWLLRQLDLHPARIDTWLGERRLGQPINAPLAETLLYFLLWWRDDAPVRPPDALGYPLARHFRDRGLASLRTGWGPQDWLVSHVCGRQHHAGHRQGDANHVSFYALGGVVPRRRRLRRPRRPGGHHRPASTAGSARPPPTTASWWTAPTSAAPTPPPAGPRASSWTSSTPTPWTPPWATPAPAPGPITASGRRCAASSSSVRPRPLRRRRRRHRAGRHRLHRHPPLAHGALEPDRAARRHALHYLWGDEPLHGPGPLAPGRLLRRRRRPRTPAAPPRPHRAGG